MSTTLQRHMGLGSGVLLVVGSVIGSGIFMKPLAISQNLPTETWILGAWAALGLVCLCGALAYGELGAMFPEAGGQYAFLREAWGPFVAFVYGWALFLVINTGTLAALGLAFAENIDRIAPLGALGKLAVAAAMILLLAVTNHLGVGWGTWLQNISTTAKLLALLGIVGASLFFEGSEAGSGEVLAGPLEPNLLTGLVATAAALFWAYEGWHQLGFSASEMRNPERDLPRALLLGLVILVVVYVVVNAAYFRVVPLEEMRTLSLDRDVPTLTVGRLWGGGSAAWIAGLVALSVFGAANPNLLSAPRALYAMARDGQVPRALINLHPVRRTPHVAIWSQAVWAVVLVFVFQSFGDLTNLVVFAALVFYGLTVAGVYRLRWTQPDRIRPYRCLGYPVVPALFIVTVAFVDARLLLQEKERANALWGLSILALGAVYYGLRPRPAKS